jgi:hypothetical protein
MNNNNVLPPQDNNSSSTSEQNFESLEIAVREGDLGNSELESNHLQKIADELHEIFPKLKDAEIRTFAADVLNTYRTTLASIPEDQRKNIMDIGGLITGMVVSEEDKYKFSVAKKISVQDKNGFLEGVGGYVVGYIIGVGAEEGHGEDEMSEDKFSSFANEPSSGQSLMNFDNIQQQDQVNNLQQQPAQSDDPVSSRTRLANNEINRVDYRGM